MTGINYVTNDRGEKTALLIDLNQLRNSDKSDTVLGEFLEDLDDMIAVELSKGEKGRPYHEVRKDFLKG
jgi:hypothetical protein